MRTLIFSIETEINGSLSFLDVKIFRENNFITKSSLLMFLEKKRLADYAQISSVLFHLNTSLVWYTPYYIVVLIDHLIFEIPF